MLPDFSNTYKYSRYFSSYDVQEYARISEDTNEIHLNKIVAKNSIFGDCIVQGDLSASGFSVIFGTMLPGIWVYKNKAITFHKPVYIDSTVFYTVTVNCVEKYKNEVTFDLQAVSDNRVIISGSALLKCISTEA